MIEIDKMQSSLLGKIAGIETLPTAGALSLRLNGEGAVRRSTENVIIEAKTDKNKKGINITVKTGTKGETVYIPVVVTESGVQDLVYNDFDIGEDCDIVIMAGCGIHNDGCDESRHDGIHRFLLRKGAKLKYIEKHVGEGDGEGARVLNPTTELHMDENSVCEMETVQIGGVDSTYRKSTAKLKAGAKLIITERLLTHGNQKAHSDMETEINGEDGAVQIVSRSVAKDSSVQVFHPIATGNAKSRAHIQCDAIIMDNAKVSAIPEIAANHHDAQIIHEAAIGRINNDQLLKLQTFGLNETEAEEVIIEGFLK